MTLYRVTVVVSLSVCLVGGAIWLASTQTTGHRPPAHAAPSHSPGPAALPAQGTSDPDPGSSPPSPAATVPAPYRVLPFTRAQLQGALDLAQRFIRVYGTYRADDDPQIRLKALAPMTSPDLAQGIGRLNTAPGLVDDLRRTGQNATADATVTQIRALTATSLTVVITSRQKITLPNGPGKDTTKFVAVEVQRTAGDWRVNAIEPAVLTDGDFR